MSHDRLQAYLRHVAHQQYEAVAVPPFTAFFHPRDPLPYFNYAIPDEPEPGDLAEPLAALRALFAARQRVPRFEWIEPYAPELAATLGAYGFAEEMRALGMTCTPGDYQRAPEVSGLRIVRLRPDSPLETARQYKTVAGRGFYAAAAEATEAEAEQWLTELGDAGAFLGYLGDEPVGVSFFAPPHDGMTELAGIATLAAFRRRGVAAALTGAALQAAFEQGVTLAYLSAGSAEAGRVYERVGFAPAFDVLAYRDGDS